MPQDDNDPTLKRSDGHQQALNQFVLYWGEMASSWGINKTMAQIHALLYAEQEPMDTDSIMEELSISRGNANMNLRKLLDWGLIHKVNKEGERREYFTAEKDVWNMAARIIRERQRMEITPIKENLKECLNMIDGKDVNAASEAAFRERIQNFVSFLELFEEFTKAILPYVSEKNLSSLHKFVSFARKRNLLKGRPEDHLPL
jgi:DNA-binding transcriptional regulator GbsR (MarR family)